MHEDMLATTLPSWIGRAPGNLGSASHGKLSADEWRTACTVNLVTSLGRIWGSDAASLNEREMLENFMQLVKATKLAHMRTQNVTRIEEYTRSMKSYIAGVIRLYPSKSLMPSHHLSLHLPRFLKLFGPVHGWRCFPFERYNHVLQQINTNKKSGKRWIHIRGNITYLYTDIGEVEATMFNSFCSAQELRVFMHSGQLPEEVTTRLLPQFERVFDEGGRGTLQNDIRAFHTQPQQLENTTRFTRLRPADDTRLRARLRADGVITAAYDIPGQEVLLQRSVTHRGVRFCTKSTAAGDSQIVFGDLAKGTWQAGKIAQIIVWPRRLRQGEMEYHTFVEVEALHPLSPEDAEADPYRPYPFVAGRLYYSEASSTMIGFQDIACHFARVSRPKEHTGLGHDCIHVLPLDRVSILPGL